MKTWVKILIIVAIIGIIVFLWIMSRKKSLSFDFDLGGNIYDLLNTVGGRYANAGPNAKGLGLYVDVPLTTIIKNKKAAAVVLNNVLGSISYNGESIMQTKADSSVLKNITVAGKTNKPVTDTVQLLINQASVKFLTELINGKKPIIKYNFATTISGKPYSFTNNSTINKK